MKTKYIFTVLILLTGVFAGCKKSAPNRDVLYFTGTEQSPETKLTVDGPGSIGISVTSSTKVDKNIEVMLQLRPELVDTYNKATGKSYVVPPQGSYSLSAGNVVIKSGSNVSEAVKLSVTSLDGFKEGTTYCVPVMITNADGGIDVLEPSRTIYVVINRTIITQAVNLAGSNYFTVGNFATDPSLTSIAELTMECRVFVNSFQAANPYISSVMGIEENFLLRFGDVSIQKNQLQLAGGLIAGKKFPVTSNTSFSTGKWYHVAVVYNGSSVTLYIDGKRDASTEASKGAITFTGTNGTYLGGFHIGFSERGRYLNGYISEARVWTKALTPTQLQNNLCYVDPTTSGLLAYWRFNGADGVNVTDLTGHGYTAVAAKTITYVQGVRCPD